ncbi:MAG: hypothetical protein KF716_33520 [Anaerolineae bacterium]|nr:hypothetical protein [Anaerolineae bacterium]
MSTRHIQAVVTIVGLAGVLMFSNMMPGTVQAQTPTLSDEIMIAGQIIPDLNTDRQEQQKLIEAGEPLNLFKYYLFDANGAEYELQFEDSLLASLGSGFFDKNPSVKSLRIYMSDHPQYMGSNIVWQEWTGQWAAIKGNLISDHLIQVHSMQRSETIPTTAAFNIATERRARQVTYVGTLYNGYASQPLENDGLWLYALPDAKPGSAQRAYFLASSPKSFTRVFGPDGIEAVDIAYCESQQCTVKGWIFLDVTQLKVTRAKVEANRDAWHGE